MSCPGAEGLGSDPPNRESCMTVPRPTCCATEPAFPSSFPVNPATSHAPVVVPRLAPKMMPMPWASPSNPALRNEMVITDTSELDCIRVVVTTPKDRLFHNRSVVRPRIFSSTPPVKERNPSSRDSMPNRNIATPAASCLKSGLTQKP